MGKRQRNLVSALAGVGISFLALNSGCASNYKPPFTQEGITRESRILERKGLIVAIEGLQPCSDSLCTNLAAEIAREYGMALSASSGDWGRHLPIIKRAHDEDNRIVLIGFSAGTEEVWNISKVCEKLRIPIDLMVYLDPTHKNNPISGRLAVIPDNVNEVLVYIGENSGFLGGRKLSKSDFKNPNTKFTNTIVPNTYHLEVPRSIEVYNGLIERFQDFNRQRKK